MIKYMTVGDIAYGKNKYRGRYSKSTILCY